jgi:acid stress chaperone HdeB
MTARIFPTESLATKLGGQMSGKRLSLCLIAAITSATATFSARAAPIDLSTWTCKQFLATDGDEMKLTLAWLDAYYKGENDPPVIDTDKFVANAQKLGAYCGKNPSIGLITATDKLFSK